MVSKKDNKNMLHTIIGILIFIVILFIWYFFWKGWNGDSTNNTSWDTPLIIEAWNMGIDKEELKKCIASDKYLDKINSQMRVWADSFGINWTPANILINNETLEYDIISWAYPKENFIAVIDRLLSNQVIENNKSDKKDFKKNTNEDTITIITDKRDYTTPINQLVDSLKQIESIKNMEVVNYDFYDNGVSEYLEENGITTLPAIIFAKNNIDNNIDGSLIKLKDNSYSLNIWAKFNPFMKLSPKWFKIADEEVIKQIRENSYIEWNENAKITWLEYSDLECPFCAKLHNSDVEATLKSKYKDDINIIFNHFPLNSHKKAVAWAEILECVWEQWWSEAFYKIMRYAFKNEIQE